MIKKLAPIIFSMLLFLIVGFLFPAKKAAEEPWVVELNQAEKQLKISYNDGTETPQYAVLHLNDSYFRLNYGPASVWSTSIILFPPFWSGDKYYQGSTDGIKTSHRIDKQNLVLTATGQISILTGRLAVTSTLNISPPSKNVAINAMISTSVATISGMIPIDNKPGEAFKPIMLSSMHISPTVWDTQSAFIGCQFYSIPESGWITQPPKVDSVFGLLGGTTPGWKTNAPTIEISMDQPRQITGWVTSSSDSNDDNVGFWASNDKILTSWTYNIYVSQDPKLRCVDKDASPSPVKDGGTLTYTVRVTNTKTVPMTPTIRDILPNQAMTSQPLVWTPTITAPGGTWMHQFTVTVMSGYTGTLTNKVEVLNENDVWGEAEATVCVNLCFTYLPAIYKNASS